MIQSTNDGMSLIGEILMNMQVPQGAIEELGQIQARFQELISSVASGGQGGGEAPSKAVPVQGQGGGRPQSPAGV